MKLEFPKITVWRAIFAAIMLSGLYATYLRVMYGLGGSTNLSDKFPWGIWIGFDVLCGVMLAAGAFIVVLQMIRQVTSIHYSIIHLTSYSKW